VARRVEGDRGGGPRARRAIAVVIAVAVVGVIGFGVRALQNHLDADRRWHQQHDVLAAVPGNCLSRVSGMTEASAGYTRTDCASRDARFVVLAVQHTSGAQNTCAAVAGATAVVSGEDRDVTGDDSEVQLCLGGKGADPLTAINTVTAGQCVLVAGDDAVRVPCSTHGAAKILKVVKDVDHTWVDGHYLQSSATAVCGTAVAPLTQSLFTWRLADTNTSHQASRFYSYDFVLCLGKPGA